MARQWMAWLAAGAALVAPAAAAEGPPAEPERESRTAPPCQIDERLSLWLSLEAADRTIAALERERRELSVERERVRERLERAEGKAGGELAEALAKAAAERLAEAYAQIDARIAELGRTVGSRRDLRAQTEEALMALLSATPPER